MFDSIKRNRAIRRSQRELELSNNIYEQKSVDIATKTLDHAMEALNNRSIVDYDLQSGEWMLMGQDPKGLDDAGRREVQQSAYKLYQTNPHARTIIRTFVKFIIGKGPKIIPDEKDEDNKEKMLKIWKDFRRRNKFNIREKENVRRLFRDGEVFHRKFIDDENGDMKLRFIRPSLIAIPKDKIGDKEFTKATQGILTEEDDIEEVLKYCKVSYEGDFKTWINADEIYHLKIFADSDEKRGNTIYGPCIRRIVQYEEWLEDRIILNKIRTAFALHKIVDSSAGKINSIREDGRSKTQSEDRNKQQMLQAGTVITTSKGIEYKMLNPNINAQDVKDDGRAIQLAVAAAAGFPEMLITGDWSNANYSSSLIAQNPFVREIEDWQDYLTTWYQDLWADIMQAKIVVNELGEDVNLDIELEYPPMIASDLDKIAKAFEILFKYKAVSKNTWQARMGLDPEIEKQKMEMEEGDEVFPQGVHPPGTPGQPNPNSPIQMPISPINQFGAEKIEQILSAIKEEDWEHLLELAEKFTSEDDHEEEDLEEDIIEKEEGEIIIEQGITKEELDERLVEIVEGFKGAIDILNNKQDKNIEITMPDININPEINVEAPEFLIENEQPDVNIKIEPQEINVTAPKVKIENKIEQPNIEVNTPNVTIENVIEQPNIEVNTPEIKVEPNIEVNTPEVRIENKIEQPEINIENKIVQKGKTSKKVIRDKNDKVIGIEETIE